MLSRWLRGKIGGSITTIIPVIGAQIVINITRDLNSNFLKVHIKHILAVMHHVSILFTPLTLWFITTISFPFVSNTILDNVTWMIIKSSRNLNGWLWNQSRYHVWKYDWCCSRFKGTRSTWGSYCFSLRWWVIFHYDGEYQ